MRWQYRRDGDITDDPMLYAILEVAHGVVHRERLAPPPTLQIVDGEGVTVEYRLVGEE